MDNQELLQALRVIVKEEISPLHNDITDIKERTSRIEGRTARIEERTSKIEERIDTMQTTMGNMQTTMGNMQTTIDGMQTVMGTMQTDIGNMQDAIGDIYNNVSRIDEISQRCTNIEIYLENNVDRNLKLLREGQAGINEKFKQLDQLTEKVEDIQTTVEVLKVLTAKK